MSLSSDDNTDSEQSNNRMHQRKRSIKRKNNKKRKSDIGKDECMNKMSKGKGSGVVAGFSTESEDDTGSKRKQSKEMKVYSKRKFDGGSVLAGFSTESEDDSESKRKMKLDSERKFYHEMEENSDVIIPVGARAKFPMKTQVETIISILVNIKKQPNCNEKHTLIKKWSVENGYLWSAPKKGKEARKVTAYEDIFHVIFQVGASNNFKKSIDGLTNDVREKSNNISEKMVQLYSRTCYKRDHKQRGVVPKKERKSNDDESKKKVEEFVEKLRNCTALGYFENKKANPPAEELQGKSGTVESQQQGTTRNHMNIIDGMWNGDMTDAPIVSSGSEKVKAKEMQLKHRDVQDMDTKAVQTQSCQTVSAKTSRVAHQGQNSEVNNDAEPMKGKKHASNDDRDNIDTHQNIGNEECRDNKEVQEQEMTGANHYSEVQDRDEIQASNSMDDVIQILGEEIETLKQTLNQKDNLIGELQDQIKDKDEQIENLKLIQVETTPTCEKSDVLSNKKRDVGSEAYCNGDNLLEEMKLKAQAYLTEDGKKRMENHSTTEIFPLSGLKNDGNEEVVCWMNSVLIIVLHQIPMHVVLALVDMGLPKWFDLTYSTKEKKFMGYVYDLVRQVMFQGPMLNMTLNGNGWIQPYTHTIAEIVKEEWNTSVPNITSFGWLHPDTQVDLTEMFLRDTGIIAYLNSLDPCRNNFLMAELNVVTINANTNERVVQQFDGNAPFDGKNGVLNVLSCDEIIKWTEKYKGATDKYMLEHHPKQKGKQPSKRQKLQLLEVQNHFHVTLTVQEILDKTFGRIEKEQDAYIFKELKSFTDCITILLTQNLNVPHYRTVSKSEDDYTKSLRIGNNYKDGQVQLYEEPMPARYNISNINEIAHLLEPPKNKEEAEGTRSRKVLRKYKLYGLVMRPITDHGSSDGHFVSLVRNYDRQNPYDEIWRLFDDDELTTLEVGVDETKFLEKYTLVAAFMKDVTKV